MDTRLFIGLCRWIQHARRDNHTHQYHRGTRTNWGHCHRPGFSQHAWKLFKLLQALFGIGESANGPFWMKIKVSAPSTVVYEMVPDASRAAWQNSTTSIVFGSTSDPAIGLAFSSANPQFETGTIENESGIIMKPDTTGLVKGTFPTYTVQQGDHFMAVIGCQYNHPNCNVKMQLGYSISGGASVILATWDEKYEGKVYKADVDLSSLVGKNINLILTVLANGDASDDYAIWLRPRIVR
jgi:hypothetical protein